MHIVSCYKILIFLQWPGGILVRALEFDFQGSGFNLHQFHLQVTSLGKLFTHMCLCNLIV